MERVVAMASAPDYLNPNIPANIARHCVPLVVANEQNLDGYG